MLTIREGKIHCNTYFDCIYVDISDCCVFPSTFVDESGKSTEGVTLMKATISAEKTYYLNALTQTGCWIPKNITASHASLQLILIFEKFYTLCVHVYFRRHGHMYIHNNVCSDTAV